MQYHTGFECCLLSAQTNLNVYSIVLVVRYKTPTKNVQTEELPHIECHVYGLGATVELGGLRESENWLRFSPATRSKDGKGDIKCPSSSTQLERHHFSCLELSEVYFIQMPGLANILLHNTGVSILLCKYTK